MGDTHRGLGLGRQRWATPIAGDTRRGRGSARIGEGTSAADWDVRSGQHPSWTKRSPAPPVHTTCIALRKAWREAYATFVDTYRGAMKR